MHNHMNNNNTKIILNNNNLQVVVDNIKLYYLNDQNTYVVTRLDNTPINGNEVIYTCDNKPVTVLEIAKQMIDCLTTTLAIQRDFNSIKYTYNADKTKIIINPIYEKELKKIKKL